jgi:hypothetical protein
MKKSEQLIIEASMEDNDFKALSLLTKSIREGRIEKFENYIYKLEERMNKEKDDLV